MGQKPDFFNVNHRPPGVNYSVGRLNYRSVLQAKKALQA